MKVYAYITAAVVAFCVAVGGYGLWLMSKEEVADLG